VCSSLAGQYELLFFWGFFFFFLGRRDINDLQVTCVNSESGCQWTGTVGTLDNHVASSCQFELIPCPNKCVEDEGTGELLLIRRDMEEHLASKCPKRAYKCPHCGKRGVFASIMKDHDKVCVKKVVPCPNKKIGCSIFVERWKTKEHVYGDCEYTEVPCVYEGLGCGVRMLRKDQEAHEKEANREHFCLSLNCIGSLSEKVSTLSATFKLLSEKHKILAQKHNKLAESVALQGQQHTKLSDTVNLREEQHKTLSEGEAIVFQLPGYASKKKSNESFNSTAFYTHPGGYKMCISIDANGNGDYEGTHVSVFTQLLKGRHDSQLHWPFLGTVTYELLNQFGDDNHHKVVITHDASHGMRAGSSCGYTEFIHHTSLGYNQATNTQYLLDDTLYFRVSVKVNNHRPWLVCSDKVPTDSYRTINDYQTLRKLESVVFKVTEFGERKASQLLVSSSSFYTSFAGYHMCIEVDPSGSGDGIGTHVSVFTKLLEGRYDNQLSWPFVGTVTYELLNQLDDDNHHNIVSTIVASNNMRIGSSIGPTKFQRHSLLGYNPDTYTQYLLDDTLYFRVSVKVNNHKSWLVCTHQS